MNSLDIQKALLGNQKMKNKLFKLFEGLYVSILTKMVVERSTSNGEMMEIVKTPISVTGFLLDADDKFYYLGHSPDLISQAVPHSEVAHVELGQEEANLMEELLVNGEIPSEDKFN